MLLWAQTALQRPCAELSAWELDRVNDHSSALKSKCRCPSDGPVSLNHFSAFKVYLCPPIACKEGDGRCRSLCCSMLQSKGCYPCCTVQCCQMVDTQVLMRFAVPAAGSAEYSRGESACSRSLELHQARCRGERGAAGCKCSSNACCVSGACVYDNPCSAVRSLVWCST